MKIFKRVLGIILLLTGGYLAFLEIGMAISESHALKDPSNVTIFIGLTSLGIVLALTGIKILLLKK